MRKVNLNMNEQFKYEIIRDVVQKRKTKTRAEVMLGLTRRSVDRLIVKYNKFGKEGFIHGNFGTTSPKAESTYLKNQIINLYENKYFDFNYSHFHEKLVAEEQILVSESLVRKLLNSEGFISPKANRKTKREHKKAMLIKKLPKDTPREDIDTIVELDLEDAHPTRERKKYFGEQIQMDASDHKWFGDSKSHLHAAIDDATGTVVACYFDKQETLNGYYNLYSQILNNYGIPYEFLTDKRTVFEYKKKNVSNIEKDTFTQFGYACKKFGTNIVTSSIPQAKGRIERLFNTFQSRLISEMRLANISTIEAANTFLTEFVKRFNQKFALPINYNTSVFENVKNKDEIDTTLAVITPRVFDNGACIRYSNRKYYPQRYGKRVYFAKGINTLVIKSLSGALYSSIGSEMYLMVEIKCNAEFSKQFDMPSVTVKKKEKYIPPMSHPWKYESFKKYVEKQAHITKTATEKIFN